MVKQYIINLGEKFDGWEGEYYSHIKCWYGTRKRDATKYDRYKSQKLLSTIHKLGFTKAYIEEIQ